jgi:3-hydroxyisobutyrate dehydrogenase
MNYGLIGTGLMGAPLGERLLAAGHGLTVYNRTAAKAESLGQQGAKVAATPLEVLQQADCVVLMLTNTAAIRETILSPQASPGLRGKTVIQMGTISPQESQDLAAAITEAGGDYLECPVLGSIPEARTGKLILLVGATPAQFDQWLPLLQCFGPQPQHIGPVGQAMGLKLAFNQLIAGLAATFALSLSYVQLQGLEVEQFMGILRESALYARTFDKKLQRMLDRDFANPNFPTQHMLKDVDLFLGAAQAAGLETQGLEGVRSLLAQAQALGFGEGDYAAIMAAIARDPQTLN